MTRRSLVALLLIAVVTAGAGCKTIGLLESIESLLAQAKALLDARKWDEALTKLTEVIRRDPAQWKAYLYAAQAYIGKLDWTAALTNARKALELSPSDPTVVTTLGDTLWGGGRDALQRGAYGDAAKLLVEYIKLRPADWNGYVNAGRAYIGSRNWGEAGRVLVDGLGRASDPAARKELASTLLDGGRQALNSGQSSGAVTLLREYVKLEPTDVNAYVSLARAYVGAGENLEALNTFRKVLEMAPQNEEARRFLLGR